MPYRCKAPRPAKFRPLLTNTARSATQDIKDDTDIIRDQVAAVEAKTDEILDRVNSIRNGHFPPRLNNDRVTQWLDDMAVLSSYADSTYQCTTADTADLGHPERADDTRPHKVQVQSPSLVGSPEVLEAEIDSFARYIQDKELLDGVDIVDLDNQADEVTRKLNQTFRTWRTSRPWTGISKTANAGHISASSQLLEEAEMKKIESNASHGGLSKVNRNATAPASSLSQFNYSRPLRERQSRGIDGGSPRIPQSTTESRQESTVQNTARSAEPPQTSARLNVGDIDDPADESVGRDSAFIPTFGAESGQRLPLSDRPAGTESARPGPDKRRPASGQPQSGSTPGLNGAISSPAEAGFSRQLARKPIRGTGPTRQPATKPASAPATFEEMGVQQGKEMDECVCSNYFHFNELLIAK